MQNLKNKNFDTILEIVDQGDRYKLYSVLFSDCEQITLTGDLAEKIFEMYQRASCADKERLEKCDVQELVYVYGHSLVGGRLDYSKIIEALNCLEFLSGKKK